MCDILFCHFGHFVSMDTWTHAPFAPPGYGPGSNSFQCIANDILTIC